MHDQIIFNRRRFLFAATGAAALGLGACGMNGFAGPSSPLSGPVKALLDTREWLNTAPLRAEDLTGKVVLVNFWTYSCINSLRMLPYLRVWADKYKTAGLVVIGVHTPEFAFEKQIPNIANALAALDVRYPVAGDSDYRTWQAFSNNAWPALYFVGADGRIRDHKLGEGDYEASEALIQKLLSESGHTDTPSTIAPITGSGPQAPADIPDLGSPETYIGYGQGDSFTSLDSLRADASHLYRPTPTLSRNSFTLAGDWTIGKEFATSNISGGRIISRFHARDLHLVMGPSADGRPVRFRVTIDGAAPGANHGVDVDATGIGTVHDPRMYQLIRQSGPISDRTFAIEFLDAGARAYVFTFG